MLLYFNFSPLKFNNNSSVNFFFVLVVEIVGKNKRSSIGLLVGVFSGLGYITLSLIAFFFRHWRTIQLIVGLVHLPFLFAFPFIPESPR